MPYYIQAVGKIINLQRCTKNTRISNPDIISDSHYMLHRDYIYLHLLTLSFAI